ncbi:MAG TPA: hypothetical protein VKR30_05710 [Candidatus Limnocylindrales bacterium]|nr:hypothetical protein [Candidatus Limnocylindrales bacterium]
MSDLPVDLAPPLAARLVAAMDRAGKIGRGLEALGPVSNRDVVLIDAEHSPVGRTLEELGARTRHVPLTSPLHIDVPDASADVVVGLWSAFRGIDDAEIAEVDRVLRPDGRLLVVHDYGRDDVSRIRGSLPEYGTWGRRGGPFLGGGFRVRVLHCWWDFESPEATTAFLLDAFGEAGGVVAASLKRPRVSWNVAIYHRSRRAAEA